MFITHSYLFLKVQILRILILFEKWLSKDYVNKKIPLAAFQSMIIHDLQCLYLWDLFCKHFWNHIVWLMQYRLVLHQFLYTHENLLLSTPYIYTKIVSNDLLTSYCMKGLIFPEEESFYVIQRNTIASVAYSQLHNLQYLTSLNLLEGMIRSLLDKKYKNRINN